MLKSHTWPVGTILDSAEVEVSIITVLLDRADLEDSQDLLSTVEARKVKAEATAMRDGGERSLQDTM